MVTKKDDPPRRSGMPWSDIETQFLRDMAHEHVPVRVIARVLRRSETAVRAKAHQLRMTLPKRSTRPK